MTSTKKKIEEQPRRKCGMPPYETRDSGILGKVSSCHQCQVSDFCPVRVFIYILYLYYQCSVYGSKMEK